MKKIIRLGAIVFVLAIAIAGCKDDDDDTPPSTSVTIKFTAKAGGEDLVLNQQYSDFLGRKTEIETLKFYISNVELIDADNNYIYVKDVALIDYPESNLSFTFSADPGIYNGIRMGLGLDPVQNASDPTKFKDTHPLATRQNTYWSWASKYRFLMIDGKTVINDTLTRLISYHTGLDTMYRVATFNNSITVKSGTNTTVNFQFEMNDIFSKLDTVDCAYDSASAWHGETMTAEIGKRLMDNFAASLQIK